MWHDGNLTCDDYNFLEKNLKLKKKFYYLTRILYEHGVNSNLTDKTKLNHF